MLRRDPSRVVEMGQAQPARAEPLGFFSGECHRVDRMHPLTAQKAPQAPDNRYPHFRSGVCSQRRCVVLGWEGRTERACGGSSSRTRAGSCACRNTIVSPPRECRRCSIRLASVNGHWAASAHNTSIPRTTELNSSVTHWSPQSQLSHGCIVTADLGAGAFHVRSRGLDRPSAP